jgi:subtilisin family serine protease
MNVNRIAAVVVALVALLIVPIQGLAAKKGPNTAAAPSGCATQTYRYDSGGTPGSGPANDPLFARQWALDQVNAPEAWARGARGAGTTVAIVDTGVDLQHPDLSSKLVTGHDFVADNNDCPAGPQDENGHGTHVAGIAAAVTNHGIGVAGVAPDAQIMPVRVLDADGSGSSEDVAAGITWAADHGAEVINLSLRAPDRRTARAAERGDRGGRDARVGQRLAGGRGGRERELPALLLPVVRRARGLRGRDGPPRAADLLLQLPE